MNSDSKVRIKCIDFSLDMHYKKVVQLMNYCYLFFFNFW
jgi:hypothetical protein